MNVIGLFSLETFFVFFSGSHNFSQYAWHIYTYMFINIIGVRFVIDRNRKI